MPKEVTAVMAYLHTYPASDPDGFVYFCSDSQAIHKFAYQGNVASDAWIEGQHAAAV